MAEPKTPKALLQALELIRSAKAPKLESLDTLEQTHVRRVRQIFEDRNIVAIGISQKETSRKATGYLSLTFYVERKLSKSKVNSNKMIPAVMSVADRRAVFTDVKQIGRILPQVNRQFAPIASGYSVGNRDETGTLGAIVKKGSGLYLLSNSHVLANSGKGKKGDKIYFPGDADRGKDKLHAVAELTEFVPFTKSEDFVNKVDAALALVNDEHLDAVDFDVFQATKPLTAADPERGMDVVIRGRTSGTSEGLIKDVHFSTVIPYPGVGRIGFIDQVLCSRYSKGGDSGSLVVQKKTGRILGLHVAGSNEGSIFSPISEVIKALKFKFASS